MSCGENELEDSVEESTGELFSFNEVEVGQTVRFWYNGGSEDGYRTVTVAKVDGDSIEGPCQERNGAYRRFNDEDASEITLVVEAVKASGETLEVRFDEAGEKLLASLSAEQLAKLYSQYVAVEAESVSYDAAKGSVVVTLPKPKTTLKVEAGDGVGQAHWTNPNGQVFGIYLYGEGDNEVGVDSVNGYSEGSVSLETLYEQLGKFLGK